MTNYNFELDLTTDNSLSIIVKYFLKENAKILEFGPANGRLTKYLKKNMDCDVDIIEIDEIAGKEASQYARRALIGPKYGDIDNELWAEELNGEKYDYIIFADVLEHLKNPEKTLQLAEKFLKSNGALCFSIPNLAHNSVIIELFNNNFKYTEIGLLDKTHISFFAYNSIQDMVNKTNLEIVEERAVYGKVGDIEIRNYYDEIPYEVGEALKNRDYSEVYQYVFKLKKRTAIEAPKVVLDKIINKLESEIYIKEAMDEEFLEDKIIRAKYLNDAFIFKFNGYNDLKTLRWDPLEQPCIVEITEIIIKTEKEEINIDFISSNSLYSIGNKLYFDSYDPQIFFDVYGKNISSMEIKCRIKSKIMELKSDIENEYLENVKKLDEVLEYNNNLEKSINLKEEKIKELEIIIENLEKEKILNV